MKLQFLAYNNYYDRLIKTETSYSNFLLLEMDNIQFNDNDGVSTEVILEDFTDKLDGKEPNYLVVYNGTVLSSRWFILDKIRTRSGQWRVSLRRDLLADYKDAVLSSTAFIEKGTLSAEDPFIFNDENFTFNQIKTAEYLLKDKT